ncbi:MAG TPA: ABC transporter substrate binding protein [Woeseiaceae bacterium]
MLLRPARTLAAGLVTALLAACSMQSPRPEPEPAPVLEPIVITQARREPPPVAKPAPAPAVVRPVPPPPAEPENGRIAIVLSDRRPAYEGVAVELGRLLGRFLLYNLADKSLAPGAAFSGIADSGAEVVIAIGFEAAQQAMRLSPLPVVFCQVFNVDVSASTVPVRGVAAIPPLTPQVRAWKKAHPGLRSIGAIVGAGHDALIAEAEIAAASEGLGFKYRIAASDRETLYIFHRMAREIDGFWLFPDNRTLSIPVLKEILSYADRHGVQVAVFNPALLELGAELAVSSDEEDVAATALAVAERIIAGEIDAVPLLSPLTRVAVRTAAPADAPAAAAPAAAKGTR